MSTSVVLQRMATVRETFRLRRLANVQRKLWLFYLEHSLFDDARKSRVAMIEHLRGACQQWRLTLGMPVWTADDAWTEAPGARA